MNHCLNILLAVYFLPIALFTSCKPPIDPESGKNSDNGSFSILTPDQTLGVGQSIQLRWECSPDPTETVTWTFSQEGVISVAAATGRLSAVSIGTVTLTGTTESRLTDSIRITVAAIPPAPETLLYDNTVYSRFYIEEFDSPTLPLTGEGLEQDLHYKIENGCLWLHDGSANAGHPRITLPITLPEDCSLIRFTLKTGDSYLPRFGISDSNGSDIFFFFDTESLDTAPVLSDENRVPLSEISGFTQERKQRFITIDITRSGQMVFVSLDGDSMPTAYADIQSLSDKTGFGNTPILIFGEQPGLTQQTDSDNAYGAIASVAFYKSLERKTAVIPQPSSLQITDIDRVFVLSSETMIDNQAGSDADAAVSLFTDRIRNATGTVLSQGNSNGRILLTNDSGISHPEGYNLTVDERGAEIRASAYGGFLYGLVTLLELLPAKVFGSNQDSSVILAVPFVSISDEPRYEYRGYMLDESRTFFGKETVLKLLDRLFFLKINRFHWHLTDDSGYRFPFSGTVTCSSGRQYDLGEFMKKAAWRTKGVLASSSNPEWEFLTQDDPDAYGGMYTESELKEIITYARERNIQMIPEFDVPGHCKPIFDLMQSTDGTFGLNCDGYYNYVPRGPQSIPFSNVAGTDICPSSTDTYEVLTYMYAQIHKIFESDYLNIGGDEARISGNHLGFGPWWYCRRCESKLSESGFGVPAYASMHQLQGEFFKQLKSNLASLCTGVIMWNTVSAYGAFYPAATDIVLDWNYEAETYNSPAPIVNASQSKYYLTYNQSQWDKENLDIGPNWDAPVNTSEMMYNYDTRENNAGIPIPADRLLGVQACYWTEKTTGFTKKGVTYTPDMRLAYMSFPRTAAIAERAWSPEECKDYASFKARLQTEFIRYDESGWEGSCQDERVYYPQ